MNRFIALLALSAAACGAKPPAGGAPMDRAPGGSTPSPSGAYVLTVEEGGELSVQSGAGPSRVIDQGVDRRLAIATDETFAVYARLGALGETDLWKVSLPEGAPVRLTAWVGSEDRPVLSPDGAQLAFISGRTGVASWYIVDLPADSEPVPEGSARQLTNTHLGPRRPGVVPEGFTPPPSGTDYSWGASGLSWTAGGVAHHLAIVR